jgi:hypothetical protein
MARSGCLWRANWVLVPAHGRKTQHLGFLAMLGTHHVNSPVLLNSGLADRWACVKLGRRVRLEHSAGEDVWEQVAQLV